MSLEGLLVGLALVVLVQLGLWAKKRGSSRDKKLPAMMDEKEIEALRQVAKVQGERSRAFDVKLAAGVRERKKQKAIDLATKDSAVWLARIKTTVAHGGTRVSMSGEPSSSDERGQEIWRAVQKRTNFIPTDAAYLGEDYLSFYTEKLGEILKKPFVVGWSKDENGRYYDDEWRTDGTYRYKIWVAW